MTTQKETRTSANRETGAGPSTTYMELRGTSDSIGAAPEPRLSADEIPHLTADERSAAIPAYVLLLKSPKDRITRRLFLSLPGAIRAAERAQQRGSATHLELFHAVPVTVDVDHEDGGAL